MSDTWTVPNAPGCTCKGACGQMHDGGTCAVPDRVSIRLRRREGRIGWGWSTTDKKGGDNKARKYGFGPVTEFQVIDGICDLCRGYTGAGGGDAAHE